MPVVQSYTPETTPQGLTGGFNTTQVDPDAFGVGIAKSVQGLGQSGQQAASDIGEIEQQRFMVQADADTSAFTSQYREGAASILAGYGQLKGYDAVNGQSDVQQKLGQLRSSIAGGISSPIMQRMFASDANSADVGFNQAVISHASDQQTVARVAAFDAQKSNAIDAYARDYGSQPTNPGDPAPADLDMAAAQKADIGRMELLGLTTGPGAVDILNNAGRQLHSDMAEGAVKAALDGTETGVRRAVQILNDSAGTIDPVAYGALHQRVMEDLLTYGGTPAAAAIANGTLKPDPTTGVVALPGSPQAAIAAAAKANGVDPAKAIAIASVESGMKNITNTSVPGATSAGVFQMNDATWAAMGGTAANRGDTATQIQLGTKLIAQNDAGLRSALGREPTLAESYLAHQQGLGGALAIIRAQPGESAVQALTDAGIPNAAAAISGNLGASLKRQASSISASDFLTYWGNKVGTAGAAGTSNIGKAAASMGAPTTGNSISATPDGRPSLDDALKGADAWAAQNAPGDGRVQKQMESLVHTEYSRQTAVVNGRQDAAWQQVNTVVLGHGSWADVPGDAKANLSPSQTVSAMKLLGSGYAKESDASILYGLYELRAYHPDQFVNADLSKAAPNLTAGDFKEMANAQLQMRNGQFDPGKTMTTQNAMGLADAQLNAIGLSSKAKPGSPQAKQYAQFQVGLLGALDQWRGANSGKEPQQADVSHTIDTLLLSGQWQDHGVTKSGPIYTAPPGAGFSLTIPPTARANVVNDLQRHGRPTDARSVALQYQQGHSLGYYQ